MKRSKLWFPFVLIVMMAISFPSLSHTSCLLTVNHVASSLDCCIVPGDDITFSWAIVASCPGLTNWQVDFGDGNVSALLPLTTLTIHHSFAFAGTYQVNVFGVNSAGAYIMNNGNQIIVRTTTQCATSNCAFLAFEYENYNLCTASQTHFQNFSWIPHCVTSGPVYTWDFGDPASGPNNYATGDNPNHIFSSIGPFTVTLTVSVYINGVLCTQSVTHSVDPTYQLPYWIPVPLPPPSIIIDAHGRFACTGGPISITFTGDHTYYGSADVDLGNGNQIFWTDLSVPLTFSYPTAGTYVILLTFYPPGGNSECRYWNQTGVTVVDCTVNLPCTDCIGSFNPEPGKKYLVSSWVREDNAGPLVTNFTNPSLRLSFQDTTTMHNITTLSDIFPSGDIIDGWQRIEQEFIVPADAASINIKMNCAAGDCLFDDIRVFPFDGTMKSYVYDPISLKLVAELDERNYATLYEYDEEGKLIRVKKETERGIMTIKESRNHLSSK